MPGAKSRVKPLTAGESSGSASDEVSHLELHLQRQLEEDVARIFDESIYSDLEVVCGKLKILTHSCILKARTHQFYHKLEAILRVNIGRDTFDEIYSFISDAYTECNIKQQEKEFINYLNDTLNLEKPVTNNNKRKQKDFADCDAFATPNCISPEKNGFQKTLNLNFSPSTELKKEYYALVPPIENNILEKELKEQDALSTAFKSFIKSQENLNGKQVKQCVKPTSLFLNSSHISKLNKHSNNCDITKQFDIQETKLTKQKDNSHNQINNTSSQIPKNSHIVELEKSAIDISLNNTLDKGVELAYSPDSLVTDEPSSSSDYVSAAYTVSPGVALSGGFSQINVCESITKMDNTTTVSDSGLETTGMLESLNSHKDVTLTDLSLTESTFLDMLNEEAVNSLDTASSTSEIKQLQKFKIFPSQQSVGASSSELEPKDMKSNKPHMITDLSGTSSKEEKQRQNEEIVILESSSLSSETGSWESVFPPKAAETDICQKFINSEREHVYEPRIRKRTTEITSITDQLCPSLVQKSPFKSTSCFIDAASLVDEGDETLTIQDERNEVTETIKPENVSHATCQPITCIRKLAISSEDLSECNEDNEDSLERVDNKDPDSIQKDESPTIFEMTPITEDSLCTNGFDNIPEQQITSTDANTNCDEKTINIIAPHNKLQTVFSSTPNNSIISLRTYDIHDSEESENDSVILRRECGDSLRKQAAESTLKFSESPIISGGVSVEDHLPQFGSYSGSPMCKRKIENIPIVTGAYVPDEEEKPEKSPRPPSNASAWVVDMSSDNKSEVPRINKKPGDKTCENLKQCSRSNSSGDTCKSRSSVDSDSSDRSTQKFYIDLSTLPDALPPEQNNDEDNNEKKNIFSLFIDLGDKSSTVKEMPARLSSSMSKKKTSKTENKSPANKIKPDADASVVKPSDVSDHSMFEKLESLCNDPNISITEIIKNRTNTSSSVNETSDDTRSNQSRSFPKEAVKSIIHEEPVPVNNDNDLFVKLSDLDKPVQTADDIIVPEKTQSFERMTRSIPENHWPDASSTNSRSVDIISSFHSENTLSLNRLFPHLKNDFSRSMPGCLSSRTRSPLRMGVSSSPGDADEHASDMSEMSSVQSSMCRSVVENSTTEDTTSQTASLISSCQSRLGQDLLRMFLEEIAPDVIVEVSGRRIKAHKCILSSRCQYFAGMLSGGWVESAGNVIILPPFSYSVAHFALCHIYSGVSMIPDSISIVELATIADMLGLEGLKEAIMFTLKAKYCHHFHKPCQVCTAGVLECFPLSSVYGLDDLYRKCLRWITRYFHKVWPTKAFATLPSELLDKCYQEHIVNLNADNLVDTVYGCGITVASLHNSRWAEVVGRMCRRVMNAAAQLAASRLVDVLRTMAVMPAAAPAPALQALHDCIHAAIEWAPPDQACKAYAFLSILVNEMRSIHYSQPDLIANGSQTKIVHDNNLLYSHASGWQLQCEGALVRAAPRVVGSQAFKDLPNDLRKRLRELGCIMFGTQALPVTSSPLQSRKTRSPHRSKTSRSHNTGTSRSLDIDQVRASFVPYAPKPQPHVGSLDLLTGAELKPSAKLGKTAPPKVRTTKAQEERAKYNLIKTYQPQERANSKTSSARPTYENTKPRYLEPRVPKEKKFRKPPARMVSSSESSRNSSPLVARAARQHSVNVSHSSRTHVSHDSLATGSRPRTADPSTDSLTDSHNTDKYATYTKTKHVAKRTAPSSQSTKQYMSPTTANKVKITKIPVFLKTSKNTPPPASATTGKVMQKKKCNTTQSTDKLANENGSPLMQSRNRNNERKPSCSLMNATKSSSAKIVPKVMKDTVNNKFSVKQSGKGTAKQGSRSPPPEIPIMERSGTFLKDEPMFGDKTTNIDIDE